MLWFTSDDVNLCLPWNYLDKDQNIAKLWVILVLVCVHTFEVLKRYSFLVGKYTIIINKNIKDA